MNFKHSWTRRLKYVFPIMMMLGTLFGLKTANVFAEKVIVDPSNPIQNVKNNFIIPKDVPNAKTNITVNGASKVYKYHVDANKGGFTDDYVGLVEGNKNIRYPSFQKEYGETNLVLEGVTTNTKVNIDYGKIGTYNGEKVNIKLVLSNIHLYSDTLPWNLLDNNYTKTHFRDDGYKNTNGAMSKSKKRTVLWISDNLFSGIVYHSTQMNVQLVATYEDGSPVQFSGDTFISFNSLNPAGGKSTDLKGEYAHYDKMNTTDWYVRKDTVLSEFKSFYNNLNVVGGHPGGSSKLTQADNDFNNLHDKLGDPKFGQGTVSFKISEANPTFVIGSSNVQTWFTLSSATIFSVVPDQPEKTGVDKNGNNVNDKMLQVGDTIQYRIKQKVNRLGVDLLAVYDRFELIDNLPKEVNYVDAHVESGTNKKFDVSGEVTYDKTKHQVKYAAKADTLKNRMKYNGETYIKVEKNKLVVTNKGILLCQAVEKEPLLTSAEMTAKWESYLLKIGERKGTQTTFLTNIQKFVSHLLEVVPGQIQSTDFGSTLQEVKAASEKQEAARHLGICPKCQEQEVLLYHKVAACTSEACDFRLWTTIAKKKLTATQLKEIIQNGRTSQPVKGLKGQKGSFEATIVLKEDFTTSFEFSEKKKTNYKKRTRRTTK